MIDLNNPGNIRPSNPSWQGAVGQSKGFVVFDTMVNGVRALCRQLLVYQDRYGIKTVRQVISRWAPPSDNNPTDAYIAFVCSVLNCQPDDAFNFRNADWLYWMVTAIGEEENGHDAFTQNVTDADINAGVSAALAA
jgi:hypothetical protein